MTNTHELQQDIIKVIKEEIARFEYTAAEASWNEKTRASALYIFLRDLESIAYTAAKEVISNECTRRGS